MLEAKRSGALPAAILLTTLRELREQTGQRVLIVSDYVGPSLRAALVAESISFADATGWIWLVSNDPLILLTGQGADRAPRDRQASAVTRLNGVAASRTIRALATVELPVGVRGLAATADVSPGSVSKLLVTLASEGIVDRDQRQRVLAVRRRALIRRWTRDYSFPKSNPSVGYYIAPRGLDRTLTRLHQRGGVTITGSVAARRSLPTSMTSVAIAAVGPLRGRPRPSRKLGLLDAEPSTANVVIAEPQDDEILPSAGDPATLVAPVALVLADL